MHQGVQRFVKDLNHLYQNEPALYEVDFEWTGFKWIDANDSDNSVFSFMRFAKSGDEFVVVVSNFTPVPRYNYRVGVPQPGYYQEILNSDSAHYGGSNVGNDGGRATEDVYWHGYAQSLSLTLPPLGTIMLKLTADRLPPP
jgi:1,4-alpha-glucan branching enzyme